VEAGKIDRLMIFMPPRHGKSELASIRFPTWFLGRNPTKRIISASYSRELSMNFGRQARNTINDPNFGSVFPSCKLAADSFAVQRWSLAAGGGYVGTSVGGTVTGLGADVFILDDPIKNQQDADSAHYRDYLWEWYQSTAYTRLEKGGAVILIMTRWHDDDIAGRLLQKTAGDDWKLIDFPAIALEDEEHRGEGDPLWPDKYTVEELERIKVNVGSRVWGALYQQRPILEESAIFKRSWFRFYDMDKLPHVFRYIWSWDTATKTGNRNDWSVGTYWAETENGYYLLFTWRGKLPFSGLKSKIIELYNTRKSDYVLIEDASSGSSIIQDLQETTAIPLLPIKVDRDKIARANSIQPLFEAGKVFFPRNEAFVNELIGEMVMFPVAKHDDQVDSLVQGLGFMKKQNEYWIDWI